MIEPALDPRLSKGARQRARERLHRESPALREICPGFRCQELTVPLPPDRWVCNPGLARHDGEIWVNLRQVNYFLGVDPEVRSYDRVHRSTNLLGRLGEEPAPVGEPADAPPLFDGGYQGMEDLRLFSFRGRLWASCTLVDRSWEERAVMAVLSFDHAMRPYRLEPQFQFAGDQKNWVPLVFGDQLCFLYSTDPLVVLRYAGDTGLCSRWFTRPSSLRLENQKGSSPALRFRGGWLYLTHESALGKDYLHRFVVLDSDLRVCSVSRSFYFLDRGVEFCAGLCRQGDELWLSFGWRDCKAYLARVPEPEVAALL